ERVWAAVALGWPRARPRRAPPLPVLSQRDQGGRLDARVQRLRAPLRALAGRDPAHAPRGAPGSPREAARGGGVARQGARGGLVRAGRRRRPGAPVREPRARVERPELARERPLVPDAARPLRRRRA